MPHDFQSGRYYIEHRDGLPHAVFGRINVTPTSGRENPPDPLSGFVCDRTPFAKGHIMALELGGPDIAANIVPQYGLWQGVGEWREMEKTLAAKHNGHYFVAWLFYNFASRDYAGQFARCSRGEVFDWNHCYIPNRIEICVLDSSAASYPVVSGLAAALSAPAASEPAFSALLEMVLRLRLPDAAIPPVRFGDSFFQWEMPRIDRDYWLGQHVFEIIGGWLTDYQRSNQIPEPVETSGRPRRGAPKPVAPVLLDDMSFTYAGAGHIKQALRAEKMHDGTPMWEDAYLDEVVTPAFCVTSRFASVPKRKWTQLQKSQIVFPYTPKTGSTS